MAKTRSLIFYELIIELNGLLFEWISAEVRNKGVSGPKNEHASNNFFKKKN